MKKAFSLLSLLLLLFGSAYMATAAGTGATPADESDGNGVTAWAVYPYAVQSASAIEDGCYYVFRNNCTADATRRGWLYGSTTEILKTNDNRKAKDLNGTYVFKFIATEGGYQFQWSEDPSYFFPTLTSNGTKKLTSDVSAAGTFSITAFNEGTDNGLFVIKNPNTVHKFNGNKGEFASWQGTAHDYQVYKATPVDDSELTTITLAYTDQESNEVVATAEVEMYTGTYPTLAEINAARPSNCKLLTDATLQPAVAGQPFIVPVKLLRALPVTGKRYYIYNDNDTKLYLYKNEGTLATAAEPAENNAGFVWTCSVNASGKYTFKNAAGGYLGHKVIADAPYTFTLNVDNAVNEGCTPLWSDTDARYLLFKNTGEADQAGNPYDKATTDFSSDYVFVEATEAKVPAWSVYPYPVQSAADIENGCYYALRNNNASDASRRGWLRAIPTTVMTTNDTYTATDFDASFAFKFIAEEGNYRFQWAENPTYYFPTFTGTGTQKLTDNADNAGLFSIAANTEGVDNGLFTVCDTRSNRYFNGNVGTFSAWTSGHAFEVYKVTRVEYSELATIELAYTDTESGDVAGTATTTLYTGTYPTAKTIKAGCPVGYLLNAEQILQPADADHPMTINVHVNPALPKDGKQYYIYNDNDTPLYLYDNEGTLATAAERMEFEPAYIWTCHITAEGKFTFENGSGKWLAHKELTDDAYTFTMDTEQAVNEGCSPLWSDIAARYLLFKNTGEADQAGNPYDKATTDFSSDFVFVEATDPTPAWAIYPIPVQSAADIVDGAMYAFRDNCSADATRKGWMRGSTGNNLTINDNYTPQDFDATFAFTFTAKEGGYSFTWVAEPGHYFPTLTKTGVHPLTTNADEAGTFSFTNFTDGVADGNFIITDVASNYKFNANPGTFSSWNNAHDYQIYKVTKVRHSQPITLTVNYTDSKSDEVVATTTVELGTGTYPTVKQLETALPVGYQIVTEQTLQPATEGQPMKVIVQPDKVLPQNGAEYYIYNDNRLNGEDIKLYLYSDNGTLATATSRKVLDESYIWTCRVDENGKYTFENGNGRFLAHKTMNETAYNFTVNPGQANDRERCVPLWSDDAARFFVVKNTGTFDQAQTPFNKTNSDYSTDFVFEKVQRDNVYALNIETATPGALPTFSWNGETGNSFVYITGETEVTAPELEVTVGNRLYTFAGFFDSEGNPIENPSFTELTANTTVTAKFDMNCFSTSYGEKWVRIQRSSNNQLITLPVAENYTDEAPVVQNADPTAEEQLWCLVGTPESFELFNKASGETLSLSTVSATLGNGTAVTLSAAGGNTNKWQLIDYTVGNVALHAIAPAGQTAWGMNPYGGGLGSPIKLYGNNDANNKWILVEAGITPLTVNIEVEGTPAYCNTRIGSLTVGSNDVTYTITVDTDSKSSRFLLPADATISLNRSDISYRGFVYDGILIEGANETVESLEGLTLTEDMVLTVKYHADEDENAQYLFYTYDADGAPYRIPAIAKAYNNTLIAISDKRWCGADIGFGHIDIVARLSNDNGETWSETQVVADGSGIANSNDNGYGDAALVADRESSRVLMMCVAGSVTFWNSSATNPQRFARVYSDDNGHTWSQPEDVTDQMFNLIPGSAGHFIGSGRIMQSRVTKVGDYYRLYCAVLSRGKGNYVIYSDDFGQTWKVLGDATVSAAPAGDEPKCEELPNGDIVLSSRKYYGRFFNVFKFTKAETGEGTWNGVVGSDGVEGGLKIGNNSTNGEIMYVEVVDKTTKEPARMMLHSIPAGNGRNSVTIFYKVLTQDTYTSTEFAQGWETGLQVSDIGSAYSTMCIQGDGKIGFFFEEEPNGYCMVYKPISIEEITDDKYTVSNIYTSIEETVNATKEKTGDDRLYDLSGRRVTKAVKGIYIRKGEKIVK